MSTIDFDAELVKAGVGAGGRLARLRYLVWRNPLGAAGAAIMGVFVFAAVFANFLTSYDPLSTNAALSLAPPSSDHWLGTDPFGRDVYARIIYGARISLAVGIGATMLGSGLGIIFCPSSDYLGRLVHLIVQPVL